MSFCPCCRWKGYIQFQMIGNNDCCQLSATAVRGTLIAVALVVAIAIIWSDGAIKPQATVSLDSSPRGASAFVSGCLAGCTPLRIAGLTPGSYSLRFEKAGYASVPRNFVLGPASLRIVETLDPVQTESLTVNIAPEGSEVTLDGEFQGHTPLVLPRVSIGWHELDVRKPNYDSYTRRIEMERVNPLVFTLALDDKIMAMLKSNIAKEPQRISHYMDMGQYLFKNRRVIESAQFFSKALEVAAAPLVFGPDDSPADRAIETSLRVQERDKLNFVITDKETTPAKDHAEFARIVETARDLLTSANFEDWGWIQGQALHYANQGKLDQAQQLLLKHIEYLKQDKTKLEQAYIFLLDIQLQMKRLDLAHETYTTFCKAYSRQPMLMRQTAHALYSKQGIFEGLDRSDVLSMAETLFRMAIDVAGQINDPEGGGQCNFELGNVLVLQDRLELACAAYHDSIVGTKSQTAREDRAQRLVECLIKMKKFSEARKALYDLTKSTRVDVATKAKQDLKTIKLLEPSPDK